MPPRQMQGSTAAQQHALRGKTRGVVLSPTWSVKKICVRGSQGTLDCYRGTAGQARALRRGAGKRNAKKKHMALGTFMAAHHNCRPWLACRRSCSACCCWGWKCQYMLVLGDFLRAYLASSISARARQRQPRHRSCVARWHTTRMHVAIRPPPG